MVTWGQWQFKSLISLIPQNLLPPSLTGRWLIMNRTHPWCHMTLWPSGYVRSRDKLKTLYPFFQKVCDHETLQGCYLWWDKITYNVTWLSDHLVTWGHVTKWKQNIFSWTTPVTTSLAMWQNKNEISPLL